MACAGGNGTPQSWRSRVWVNNPHGVNPPGPDAEMFVFGMTHEFNWPSDSTDYFKYKAKYMGTSTST